MKKIRNMTLVELAAYVQTQLRADGIEAGQRWKGKHESLKYLNPNLIEAKIERMQWFIRDFNLR